MIAEQVDGELVVYNEEREPILRLNRPATLVWLKSDGRHSVSDLSALLAEELGGGANEDRVMIALDELAKHDLIESGYERRQQSAVRMSRRSFVRRAARLPRRRSESRSSTAWSRPRSPPDRRQRITITTIR